MFTPLLNWKITQPLLSSPAPPIKPLYRMLSYLLKPNPISLTPPTGKKFILTQNNYTATPGLQVEKTIDLWKGILLMVGFLVLAILLSIVHLLIRFVLSDDLPPSAYPPFPAPPHYLHPHPPSYPSTNQVCTERLSPPPLHSLPLLYIPFPSFPSPPLPHLTPSSPSSESSFVSISPIYLLISKLLFDPI